MLLILRYEEFVEGGDIDPSLVLILLHRTTEWTNSRVTGDATTSEFSLLPQMSGLRVVSLSIDNDDDDNLRLEFNSFLCRVISNVKGQKIE